MMHPSPVRFLPCRPVPHIGSSRSVMWYHSRRLWVCSKPCFPFGQTACPAGPNDAYEVRHAAAQTKARQGRTPAQRPRRGPRPHHRRMRQRRRTGRHTAERGLCGTTCFALVAKRGALPHFAAFRADGSQPGHLSCPCRGGEQPEPANSPCSCWQFRVCGYRFARSACCGAPSAAGAMRGR